MSTGGLKQRDVSPCTRPMLSPEGTFHEIGRRGDFVNLRAEMWVGSLGVIRSSNIIREGLTFGSQSTQTIFR